MTINNKSDHILYEDLITAGLNMGLKKKKCDEIIDRVVSAVDNFEQFAEETGIREKTYAAIKKVLNENQIICRNSI